MERDPSLPSKLKVLRLTTPTRHGEAIAVYLLERPHGVRRRRSGARRPFRFGLALDASEGRRERVIETAKRAEAAGVDVLMASDHLGQLGCAA